MNTKANLYIGTLFSILFHSCVSTTFIVNPLYGIKINKGESIIIHTIKRNGFHDYELESRTIKALNHCDLKFISYDEVSQVMYRNLLPISSLELDDKMQLNKMASLTKAKYLLLNGFINKLPKLERSLAWNNEDVYAPPTFKYGIIIYDLELGKQILNIESKSTAINLNLLDDDPFPDDFGLNKSEVISKTKKRILKKLTQTCKCHL